MAIRHTLNPVLPMPHLTLRPTIGLRPVALLLLVPFWIVACRQPSTGTPFTDFPAPPASSPKSAYCVNEVPGRDGMWVSAYLASWQHDAGTPYTNWGILTPEDLEWDAFTHLVYFALNVGEDGTPGESLDPRDRYNFTTDRFRDIVPVAHANDRPILFSVGGAGNYRNFSRVIADPERTDRLVDTILGLIGEHGFDGVDLDMEPIRDGDVAHYKNFVYLLRERLAEVTTRRGERPLLTAAVNGQFGMFGELQACFDQINLMSYDLSGPWSGWQAWHNSPLYSDGVVFASTGGQKPSVDLWVDMALEAGIPNWKLGIGIDFYGYIWNGVSRPGQGWSRHAPPTIESPSGGSPFRELATRFDLDQALWDEDAGVPYLSLECPERFVSYDDSLSVALKMAYIRERALGGAILWELSGGYLPDRPTPLRHPLLQAVRDGMRQPTPHLLTPRETGR